MRPAWTGELGLTNLPGWLLGSQHRPTTSLAVTFAHTSPIYVRVGGKAIRQPDEVAYLIKQMEEARREIACQGPVRLPKGTRGRSCLSMKKVSGLSRTQKDPSGLGARRALTSQGSRSRLLVSQGFHWVHASRPACRHIGRKQRNRNHCQAPKTIGAALFSGRSWIRLAAKRWPKTRSVLRSPVPRKPSPARSQHHSESHRFGRA